MGKIIKEIVCENSDCSNKKIKVLPWVVMKSPILWKIPFSFFFSRYMLISRNDTIVETGYIPDDLAKEAIAPQEKNYADLKVFIKELNQSGIETTRWEVNLHAKLAFSFINMIVVLFAIPLVAFRPSTELAFGAGISVFLQFYWNSMKNIFLRI